MSNLDINQNDPRAKIVACSLKEYICNRSLAGDLVGTVITGKDRVLTSPGEIEKIIKYNYEEINIYNPCIEGFAAYKSGNMNSASLINQAKDAIKICAKEIYENNKDILVSNTSKYIKEFIGFRSDTVWADEAINFRNYNSLTDVIKANYLGMDLIGSCGTDEYKNIKNPALAKKI